MFASHSPRSVSKTSLHREVKNSLNTPPPSMPALDYNKIKIQGTFEGNATHSGSPNRSIKVMLIGARRSTSERRSYPSWAMLFRLIDASVLFLRPKLSKPLFIMSLCTNRRKMSTRVSNGIAKGILLSTPNRGDNRGKWVGWRRELVRGAAESSTCCSSCLREFN